MRQLSRKVVLVVAIIATAVMPVASQTPPAQKPSFEVASVKPSTRRGPIDTPSPGRFLAVGQSLRILIGYAYRLRDFQVIGGPAWMDNDLWEIQAKAEEGTIVPRPPTRTVADAMKIDTTALMLQSVLEERFQLKLHGETRDLLIYELVVAKAGAKIRLAEDQTPLGADGVRVTPPPRLPNGLPALTRGSYSITVSPTRKFEAKAIPLDLFINVLINQTGRTVIDKTGLAGLYDVKMEWTPDTLQAPLGTTADGPPAASAPGTSLTTAIQEQLGLRLESAKGPVQVLVIDSVQKPSEN